MGAHYRLDILKYLQEHPTRELGRSQLAKELRLAPEQVKRGMYMLARTVPGVKVVAPGHRWKYVPDVVDADVPSNGHASTDPAELITLFDSLTGLVPGDQLEVIGTATIGVMVRSPKNNRLYVLKEV